MTPVRRQRDVLVVMALGLVAGGASIVLSHGVVDDAFITFRYAENLAAGRGWVYNVGESFNAATSPLYVLVLTVLALVGVSPRSGANVVGVLAVAATATCTFVAVRQVRSTAAGALAATFAVLNPWFPLYRGMETALVIALAAAAVMVVGGDVRRHEWVLGVLGGLLLLARGDTAILVAVAAVVVAARERRLPWRAAVATAALAGAWSAVAWATLGSPLPETVAAKAAQGRSGFWGPRHALLTDWMAEVRLYGLWPWIGSLLALSALGLALTAGDRRARPLAVTVAAWAGLHLVAYGVVLGVPGYFWYYGPVVWCLAVLAGLGAEGLLRAVCGRRWPVGPAAAAVAALFGLLVVPRLPNDLSYHRYAKTALWITGNTGPAARVAAAEIGYIGYATGRPMVDFLGLLDSEAAGDMGRGDTRRWLYRSVPDVYVTHRPVWPLELQAITAPGFRDAYELAAGADGLWVFARRGPLGAADGGHPVLTPRLVRDELRRDGILTGPADDEAVDALVSVLVARSDLQQAMFVDGERLDMVALLDWAQAAPGPAADGDATALARHRAAFAGMAGRLRSAGRTVIRFTEPLPALPAG